MEMIAKGAEAELFLDGETVVKKRARKGYRLAKLDDSIRGFRTRREAKILQKLPREIGRPKLLKVDDKAMEIDMSFIRGEKVRDILEENMSLCADIGRTAALMHNAGIIHGDLTTSNMIYNPDEKKIYMIDFGLSFFSGKTEDKAVDLHLLRQALESKHYTVYEEAFRKVLAGYREKSDNYKEVMERLRKVEARGRNKEKS